jgi:hypothetical protein
MHAPYITRGIKGMILQSNDDACMQISVDIYIDKKQPIFVLTWNEVTFYYFEQN